MLQTIGRFQALGAVDRLGHVVVPPEMYLLYPSSEGRMCVKRHQKGRFGYLDDAGQVVIPPRFTHATTFAEGVATAGEGAAVGLIDRDGSWVIEPRFGYLSPFRDGRAVATDAATRKAGLVDRTGGWLLEPTLPNARLHGERIVVTEGKKQGAVDLQGHPVIPARYKELRETASPCFAFLRGGKWGLLDPDGQLLVKHQFQVLGHGDGTVFPAQRGDKWGVIDRHGEEVLPFVYDRLGDPSEGAMSFVRDGVAGLMDLDGQVLVADADWDWVRPLQGGFAVVDDRFVITLDGSVTAIDHDHRAADPFEAGRLRWDASRFGPYTQRALARIDEQIALRGHPVDPALQRRVELQTPPVVKALLLSLSRLEGLSFEHLFVYGAKLRFQPSQRRLFLGTHHDDDVETSYWVEWTDSGRCMVEAKTVDPHSGRRAERGWQSVEAFFRWSYEDAAQVPSMLPHE